MTLGRHGSAAAFAGSSAKQPVVDSLPGDCEDEHRGQAADLCSGDDVVVSRRDMQGCKQRIYADYWSRSERAQAPRCMGLLHAGVSLAGGHAHQQEVTQRTQRARPGRRLAARARAGGAAAGRPVHALNARPPSRQRSGDWGGVSRDQAAQSVHRLLLRHASSGDIAVASFDQVRARAPAPQAASPDRRSQRTCTQATHPCRLLENCSAVHPDLLVACSLNPLPYACGPHDVRRALLPRRGARQRRGPHIGMLTMN